ncbi:OprO/OprP family phosphate-selective porin [bacterium]|nr:OprO/OprP family phosphate-selective porin [bacterium]MBU1958433.1 OprO/OprP family phosphate-selective porin [bacterium]
MKKIILSTVAIATMAIAGGDSSTMNHENSDATNSEIEALKQQMGAMQTKLSALENKEAPKAEGVLVKSNVPVINFSGTHYLGFVNSKDGNDDSTNRFETRRNYLQAKAYFEDNPKDYMRITLDTHNVDDGSATVGKDLDGTWNVRLKYAFLYLDDVLPNTGVELGQAHRPWIDYEEHGSWNYRSISKVMVEDDNAAHLTNSADIGVNFKTKTPYFSSELGLFNGEGYHNVEDGEALSGEWRLTGHLLATGKEKSKKSGTYANVSFFGQQNRLSNKHKNEDLNWMGVHAVYNQPEFLVAAQYVTVDEANAAYKGKGYSVNGEYRIAPKWNAIGRYDFFDMDDNSGEKKRAIAGITYAYNHNVEFIANYLKEGGSNLVTNNKDQDAIMLTAAVEW